MWAYEPKRVVMTTETSVAEDKNAQEIVKIPFEGVTDLQLAELGKVLESMHLLREDLTAKAVAVKGWYDELNGMIEALIADKHVAPDTKLEGQVELAESVRVYLELLAKVASELSGEIGFFARFLTNEPPSDIEVGGKTSLNASELVAMKTAAMRKSAKQIKRSSQISFSRYEHALSGKIRRLKSGMFRVLRSGA